MCFAIVQQLAETNASPRKSGKPTRHQRRIVGPPGLAGGDTGLLFSWSVNARFKCSPATVTAAPHTSVVNVLSPLRIFVRWLKGVALCIFAQNTWRAIGMSEKWEGSFECWMSISFRM